MISIYYYLLVNVKTVFKIAMNISPCYKKKKETWYTYIIFFHSDIWVKVFKNEPSKTCGRQPLKNLK